METITILTLKGGTGKTATAVSIADGLARVGNKVLLIDLDPQSNASQWLLNSQYNGLKEDDTIYNTILKDQPLRIYPTYRHNLDIVPSHVLLSDAHLVLPGLVDRRENILNRHLQKVKDNYDFVIIDCHPDKTMLEVNALMASDSIIIPTSPGISELKAINIVHDLLDILEYKFNHKVNIRGYLLCMADQTTDSRATMAQLQKNFPKEVFKTFIPRNAAINKARTAGLVVQDFDKNSDSAVAYSNLVDELLNGQKQWG